MWYYLQRICTKEQVKVFINIMWKLFTTLLEIIYVVPKHNGTTCAGIGLSIYLLVGIPELLLGYASNDALIA